MHIQDDGAIPIVDDPALFGYNAQERADWVLIVAEAMHVVYGGSVSQATKLFDAAYDLQACTSQP